MKEMRRSALRANVFGGQFIFFDSFFSLNFSHAVITEVINQV